VLFEGSCSSETILQLTFFSAIFWSSYKELTNDGKDDEIAGARPRAPLPLYYVSFLDSKPNGMGFASVGFTLTKSDVKKS